MAPDFLIVIRGKQRFGVPLFIVFLYQRNMLGCGHQLRNQGQLEYLYQIRGALTPHR